MTTNQNERVVVVGGSRRYKNKQKVYDTLNNEAKSGPLYVIDGGYNKGAQQYARDWRSENNMRGRTMAPNWQKGPKAASNRNYQMVNYGAPDKVLAFHENYNKSVDTKNLLNHASRAKRPVEFHKGLRLKSFATSEEAKAKESDKFVIGPRLQGLSLDTDKCVLWPGAVREGYGVKKIGSTTINAHRYVYEKATGKKIPKGYAVDHKCRNRLCVNPKHLEVVTHSENMTRSWAARVKKKDSAKTLQRDAAVATGAGILLAPRKYAVPYSDVHGKIDGSTAKTKHLASISGGSGRRFYDQRHVDNMAAAMKESGFDSSKPIQIEQAKDGTKKIADGNHRLRAAQQAGIKDIPIRVVNNNQRTTTTTSNLLTHSLKLKRLERARRPVQQQENAYKAIPGWAKKLNSLKSASEFKAGKYIGGATAATALGTYGYARRKEIKDLTRKIGA